MLIDFFLHLKERRVPATITEYLALLEALQAGLANCRMDDFYALARMCLVKNEAHYDRFDVAFGEYFDRIRMEGGKNELPEGWLQNAASNVISTETLAALDIPLIEDLPKMEQSPAAETEHIEDDRQKMMGGGNSPIGLGGINREGIRLEGVSTGNRKAIKPWDSRQFQGLDDEVELGTRNIK
ncbi:MAG: hypothetical protein LBM56_02820, partial [Burkholderiaceae bacterium]|nr:hypothetical protein [Burkholderiaceae bacterium]